MPRYVNILAGLLNNLVVNMSHHTQAVSSRPLCLSDVNLLLINMCVELSVDGVHYILININEIR